MTRPFLLAFVLGLALPAAHAQQAEVISPELAEAVVAASTQASRVAGRLETGLASWYGRRFHGQKTASGERFDMDAFTAAHPWLPFGSWVRVRNLVDGRSIDVRINDRGPHVKRRIIDLSRAAAEALGLAGSGTRQVEITLLPKRPAETPVQLN